MKVKFSEKDSGSAFTLRELAPCQRPQERLEQFGAAALSDSELLAMLLRSGSRKMDVLTLANTIIREAGSLAGLLRWRVEDFVGQHGIGNVKALQLMTVFEVARRILQGEGGQAPILDTAEKVFKHLQPTSVGIEVEKFWVLSLNRKNRLLKLDEVTTGTATSSVVHPRETFRTAIANGAAAIIVAHNHPSGDPAPSSADFQVTRRLYESSKVLDIDLLDHVILGNPASDPQEIGYYSFNEAGVLG
jgi:DNA repair protein RadC